MQDRRIFARVPISLPIKLKDLDTDKNLQTETCDISGWGLGLISKEPLARGEHLELWLDIPEGKEPFHTTGTVAWSTSLAAGTYRIGITFDQIKLMAMSRIFKREPL